MEQIVSDTLQSQNPEANDSKPDPRSLLPRPIRLGNQNHKLNSDQLEKVLFWIATCRKSSEVMSLCDSEFGVDISYQTVSHYKNSKDYAPIIQKIRQEWNDQFFLVDIANKRHRLEKYGELYDENMKREKFRDAKDVLDSARHECEKEIANVHYTNVVFNGMTNEELENEKLKTLKRIQQLQDQRKIGEVHVIPSEEGNGAEAGA